MSGKSLVAVTALALLLASAAVAHRGATGIVKKRMDAMTSIGSAMKGLTAMLRGKQAYDPDRVKASAKIIAGHGGESMTSLFPEGSLKHPSRAKAAIWADWERFSALARELAVYAGTLTLAAANPRPPGRGGAKGGKTGAGTISVDPTPEELSTMAPDVVFERLRRTCSDCHRIFREKSALPAQPGEWFGRLSTAPAVRPASTAANR